MVPAVDCLEPRRGGRGRALRSSLSRARAIDDKYSRREEYRGFTQDFKEKDGYKPDVKIEYVDETGRKLTPKEVRGPLRQGCGQHSCTRGPLLGVWGPGEVSEALCLGLHPLWWAQQFPSQGWQKGQTGALVPLPTCPLSCLTCPQGRHSGGQCSGPTLTPVLSDAQLQPATLAYPLPAHCLPPSPHATPPALFSANSLSLLPSSPHPVSWPSCGPAVAHQASPIS